MSDEIKGWTSLKNAVKRLLKRDKAISNITIARSGNSDSATVTENGIVFNLRKLPEPVNAGINSNESSHPFKMQFGYDGSDNPIVTFDSNNTDVLIRGTNDFYAPTAGLQDGGATGKPINIEDEIALTSNATNYIYLEAVYNDSTSTEPDIFEIAVYQTEQSLVFSDTDEAVTPNELYQYVGAVLIGTIELNADDELVGTGLNQHVITRLYAELFYVSSIAAFLMVP